MQNVMQEFTIGFFDTSGVFSIYAKQNDVGRYLKFHIRDDLDEYAEMFNDDDLAVTVREQLPSGTNLPDIPVDSGAIDREDMSVTIPLTKEMTQEAGVAICDLVFFSLSSEEVISTTRFKLIIEKAANKPSSSTQEMFDTWTELYIAIRQLENQVETNEPIRVANENERIANENTRIANENQRITNEEGRVTAEEARDTAEQQREEAERIRESRVQEQVDLAHMWADGMSSIPDEPSPTNNAKAWAMMAQAVSGVFNGTEANWNNLPLEEKRKYHTVMFVDDYIYISYDYNRPAEAVASGGMVASQAKSPNIDIRLRDCTFIPPVKKDDSDYTTEGEYRYKKTSYSYTFVEWNTKSDGTGVGYAEEAVYSANVGVTLFAIWEQHYVVSDEQYYLTVEADEHVATHTPSQWVDKGESVNVEATAQENYKITSGTGPTGAMNEPKTVRIVSELVILKFSSDEPFTLSVSNPGWDGTIEYSIDEGDTWSTWDGSQLSGTATQPIYLRGTGNTIITGSTDEGYNWTFTGKYCTGNIETLLDYQTVVNGQHPTMGDLCYARMFSTCSTLITAPELPATTLSVGCYQIMFDQCIHLVAAPELPATTLADSCYANMFYGCKALTTAPNLPATEMVKNCYASMLMSSGLTTAPNLPAMEMAETCYYNMFRNCRSLTTAPRLPATTLAYRCYEKMFMTCISLTTIPELPVTALAERCYQNMFDECTSLKLSTTQTDEYQYAYRIPTSGTGITATDALTDMFTYTGGTFKGTPTINTTYYTDHEPV